MQNFVALLKFFNLVLVVWGVLTQQLLVKERVVWMILHEEDELVSNLIKALEFLWDARHLRRFFGGGGTHFDFLFSG